MDILKQAQALSDELKETYRLLHKNAELGFELDKTVGIIISYLDKINVKYHTDGKYVVCDIGNSDSEAFLLRADMDALPVSEKTGLSFCSQNDAFHGCGHDAHSTMLLGAVKLLKNNENKINGRVRCLFQPAEEILEGAKYVIDNGVLKDVFGGMMLHIMTATSYDTGTAIVSSQEKSAPSADFFTIKINGKGGHGSSPHNCIDPIIASAHLLCATQQLNSREIPPQTPFVLTIGEIKGGSTYNVIPEQVIIKGNLRTFDENIRNYSKSRLCDITNSISKAFRVTSQLSFDKGCPSLLNDKNVSQRVFKALVNALGNDRVITTTQMSDKDISMGNGSEDFSYISQKIPTVMVALSAGKSSDGFKYPLHNPKNIIDQNVLPYGTAVYTASALAFLK